MPPSIGIVIDIQTDNKNRTLPDLRLIVKNKGGTVTPTAYLFERRGRVVFESDERNLGVDEILDEAIEAGADDVETDDDGKVVVWTDPSSTMSAADALTKALDLKVAASNILWDAKEDTKVPLESEEVVEQLLALVEELKDQPTVQGVYANVKQGSVDDEAWTALQSKLDL